MPIGDPYCSLAQLKDYLKLKVTDTNISDTVLLGSIATATADIERICQRQFNHETVATPRVFEPYTANTCYVDEFWTTDGLIVETDPGGTGTFSRLWTSDNYELYPLNGMVSGQPGWPYRKLRPLFSFYFPKFPYPQASFYGRRATVRVTAQWGWAAVPAPVYQACLMMAAANAKAPSAPFGVSAPAAPFGTSGAPQMGMVTAKDPNMAMAKLERYMRSPIRVG